MVTFDLAKQRGARAAPRTRAAASAGVHEQREGRPQVRQILQGRRVQRVCAECEEELHRAPNDQSAWDEGRDTVGPEIESGIQSLRGGGQPLPAPTRVFFEPRFGDLSAVRVHDNVDAATAAHSVRARAFTLGSDVVFAAGAYTPQTPQGRRLLAHELTHVVQQRETEDGASLIARTPLDVPQIKTDIDDGTRTPPELFSWLHVMGHREGEIGHGATAPSQVTGPDAAPVPTDSALPIVAHFFPSFVRHHDRRALVVGGFHGKEHPGFELAEALLDELRNGTGPQLHFHTLLIPYLNPGGIADELSGVARQRLHARCNRQLVDLNRNFRLGTLTPAAVSDCRNTVQAPIQPETQALIDTITAFQPQRIVSLHAIGNAAQAGIFADAVTDVAARQLACSMAGRIVAPANRRGNQLSTTNCNPEYPGPATGPTSFGQYGPTHSIPGETVPVITVEVPGHQPLAATGRRTAAAFLPALHGFLEDPALADAVLLREIETLSQAQRRLFLTGRVPPADALLGRIRARIRAQVGVLNGMRPPGLPAIDPISHFRGFESGAGAATGQAHIIFGKFTLTGAFRKKEGWDTLPDRYYVGGNRSAGVNRAAWLAEASATRLDIILRFSAVPGASRHHWGTDVDFNSVANADWAPPSGGSATGGRFFALGQWLQANAGRVGFVQSYAAGRTGGHADEPWHWSYAPIALRLREMYGREVQMTPDVLDPTMDFFTRQAAQEGITLPSDLRSALMNLNIAQYVNTIGPGL